LVKALGVESVTTDAQALTATVTFDSSKTSAKKLADDLGKEMPRYKATVRSEKSL